jgi:hypothetical protein
MKNGNGKARRVRLGHRNIGIVLCVFILFLVVTGVLLNHARDLGLDANSVPAAIADRYYADIQVEGYEVSGRWLYAVGETLFLDQEALGFCGARLAGAVRLSDFIVAACESEVILLTDEGVIVERLGSAHGVPTGIEAVVAGEGSLTLRTSEGIFSFDPQSLSTTPVVKSPAFPSAASVPGEIMMTEAVSWEQFILDVHSGRYLGAWGVWLSDLVALLLAVLAISGITLALMPRSRSCNGN